jgi:polar amino acid transport system substrate-binding protein
MTRRRQRQFEGPALAGVVAAWLVAACGAAGPSGTPAAQTLDPASDQLGRIQARGTLVAYYEPDYAPQSDDVDDAVRDPGTKCTADQRTANQVEGYDNEVSKLVARRLGVEACFIQFPFAEVVAGNWGNQIDIAYASGSINADRMTRLYMTQPYYSTPNRFYVKADSAYTTAAELSGKQVGSCTACTHEAYLKRELQIPGVALEFEVENPVLVGYATELPGLQAVASGEIDAFLCGEAVGQEQIEAGAPLRALEKIAFDFYPAGFIDKSSGYDPVAFVTQVTDIIRGLHADGTLKTLSLEWFGIDYATTAAAFDLAATGQQVP